MLYRPNFCANCGEKIDRSDWGIFTSRRFCGVCESEYKGTDLIPRFVVGAGLLVGVLGIGSYLRSGPAGEAVLLRQPRRLSEQSVPTSSARPAVSDSPAVTGNSNTVSGQPEGQDQLQTPQASSNLKPQGQPPAAKTVTAEPMYYCGAETKKGTPCSRRVKGNIRCFQHIGMPAMVSADKLKVN